jgi:hypothetical protein
MVGMRQRWAVRARQRAGGAPWAVGNSVGPGPKRPGGDQPNRPGRTRRSPGPDPPALGPTSLSNDKHGIAITVEPVPVTHGPPIGLEHQIPSAERAHEHE